MSKSRSEVRILNNNATRDKSKSRDKFQNSDSRNSNYSNINLSNK